MTTSRLLFVLCLGLFSCLRGETVQIVLPASATPRVEYAAERLATALREAGYTTERSATMPAAGVTVRLGLVAQPDLQQELAAAGVKLAAKSPGREGFVLSRRADRIVVAGADDSGVLYGCLELAQRVRESGRLPDHLQAVDQPVFTLRGPCVGLQKTYILPGRHVYEYPYTKELFPFFYDRAYWQEYLDFLADNRMNTLYLWSGSPFGSLVRLPDYPYATEVSEAQFQQNVAMYRYIAAECDRRGIWLVQMFYNIILPQPFAERNGIATQLSRSVPVAADYTRKAIAEFVKQYPHVGLMPCLGEALQGTPNQIEWATRVILPGVKDGMAAAGLKEEPPVVFRTHAMEPEAVMPEAFKVYSNLFTETKYNGESLTTWEPRGKSQATHLAMARLGPHLVNIHILANLEPFRYGAQQFIQKSMQASRDRLGATGLHLYPLFYWNWPDAPDKTAEPLKQWQRDWIWFEAWGRYAWNPDVPAAADRAYWVRRIGAMYGSEVAGAKILDAYNAAGECAPRIIRRFGITEGNRQTMSLGMTLDQLVRPEKYGVISDLWLSQSPEGERLPDYVEKELAGQPHVGETPPQIARDIVTFAQQAVDALAAAVPHVQRNREEFARLQNDAACILALSQNYAEKATAARFALRFDRTHDLKDMEHARLHLARSLEHFRTLERLTRDTYLFANSMQTSQRRIPIVGGADGKPANYHWSQLLPVYEKELADYDAKLAAVKVGGAAAVKAQFLATMKAVPFRVLSAHAESYTIKAENPVFTDRRDATIVAAASELDGLKGIRFSHDAAKSGRLEPIEFSTTVPVRVLVGYVQADSPEWRKAPSSETDAMAAERGGTEPLILDAVQVKGLPKVNVYELRFGAGTHRLEPSGQGSYLVLGVVAAEDAK
ncbi:glycoside hydrolase family 20 zincin-like fold domain-containing protein [Opitutus sp. ER46]|uniref:glycoside hydrolase family 20 zincin-like fold domain-containing protein n=1 Tax=Opitutus sp. ER46 TaxID=2161864 RepID=UPI000D3022CA|nr:glycoside hydrolase family 20 zincin-like fold domain-containing protein [Opitutus sp. ER46]PTX94386.1 hypothetical protein DB354_11570 [Opitutus sp. ER46]